MLFLSAPSFFLPVAAGPLNSFAASPIPYWDDDSSDVDMTWDSTDQTVTITDTELNETGYYEDMNDVSDWAIWEGTGMQAAGGIGFIEILGDNAFDRAYSNVPSITDATGYRVHGVFKSNVSNTNLYIQVYPNDAHGGGGESPIVSTVIGTSWVALTGDITIAAVESIVFMGRHATDDVKLQAKFLRITNDYGELNIGIPLLEQDIQTVSLYMDTTHLDSEITLELYADTTASGTSCTLNDTHVTFDSSGFIGTTVQTDGWTKLTFNNYQEIATAEIVVSDNSSVIQDYWIDEYTFTGVNWLKLSDTSFNGSFTLMYINGDTNYTTFYETKVWNKTTDSPDSDIDQGLYHLEVNDPDDVQIDHQVVYEKEFAYLQYFRVEQQLNYDPVQGGGDYAQTTYFNCSITIDYLNGTENFFVAFEVNLLGDTVAAGVDINSDVTIRFNGDSYGPSINQDDDSIAANQYSRTQIMVWRTFDDYVGVGFTSDTYLYQLDSESTIRTLEDFTIWTSPEPIDYWGSCTVALDYDYYAEAVGGAQQDLSFYYDAFEYEYYLDEGVAQPHFSSTFWDNTGRAWHIGSQFDEANGGTLATWDSWEEIPVNDTIIEEPKSIWETLLEIFSNVGAHLQSFAGGITVVANFAWTGFVTVILGAVNLFASAAEGILNVIAPGAGTGVTSAISSLLGSIAGIFSLIGSFFGLLGYFMTFVAGGLAWANTYIFTTQMGLLIGLALILLPLMALLGNNIMGKGTGYQGAMAWLLVYVGLGMSILSLGWRLISGILNIISGFIPFT